MLWTNSISSTFYSRSKNGSRSISHVVDAIASNKLWQIIPDNEAFQLGRSFAKLCKLADFSGIKQCKNVLAHHFIKLNFIIGTCIPWRLNTSQAVNSPELRSCFYQQHVYTCIYTYIHTHTHMCTVRRLGKSNFDLEFAFSGNGWRMASHAAAAAADRDVFLIPLITRNSTCDARARTFSVSTFRREIWRCSNSYAYVYLYMRSSHNSPPDPTIRNYSLRSAVTTFTQSIIRSVTASSQ